MTDRANVALISIRVRPRSKAAWTTQGGELVLGVAAPPAGGAANEAARRALAEALGVAPSRVSLHRGARSTRKVFSVAGVDRDAADAALAKAVNRDRRKA